MENKKTLFVLLACALFAGVLCDAPVEPAKLPTSTDSPTTVPADPTTIPSTSSSTTTTTTTTTAPPSTTTVAPTTPPPTTTSAPPAPPAPPTPAPAPVPSDGRGNWTISGKDNVTCIIAQMILSANIAYPLQTPNKTLSATLSVPANANSSGSCDPTSQSIKLTWNEPNNSLQIDFTKNSTSQMYFISKVDLTFVADSKTFPNISSEYADKQVTFSRVQDDFMIKVNQSFRCSREQDLPLNSTTAIKVELALSSVQLQAFHEGSTAMFGTAQDCELDTPDIVPIAVGCALAALVCVVLVAYLIGRRRSQARGYLSM